MILIDSVQRELVEKDLLRIRSAILRSEPSEAGLLSGELGKIIYAIVQFLHEGKQGADVLSFIQSGLIHTIQLFNRKNTHSLLSLSDGLPGLGIVLNRLAENHLLDSASRKILIDVEKTLFSLIKGLDSEDYDYFYGLTGLANYYISFSRFKGREKALSKIFSALLKSAIQTPSGITWRSANISNRAPYNLGLAHGVLSIIIMLSKGIRYFGPTSELTSTLRRSIAWYLQQENHPSCSYRFSSSFDEMGNGKNTRNRLAWCYGDLSASIALAHAHAVTGDVNYYRKALEIAEVSTLRNSLDEVDSCPPIYDAGLCHGISSIAFSYSVLARYFLNERLQEAFHFWTNALLRRCNSTLEDECAGCYKISRYFDRPNEFHPNLSLLEGTAGVGLFYISILNPSLDTVWSPIFLNDIIKN